MSKKLNSSLPESLESGRHKRSPVPMRMARPSESWTSGRKSSKRRREFSPNQNMLDIGAMPRRCTALRAKSTALTSTMVSLPGLTLNCIGTGVGRAVEQRVERGPGCRSASGLRSQNSRKLGKLLGDALDAGVHGDAARGNAVALVFPERAPVAGALEGDELVEDIRVVQRRVQAESGEAAVRRQVAVFADQRAVVEIRLRQTDLLLVAAGEFVERHRLAVTGSRDGKTSRGTAGCPPPTGLVRIEADVAILVVGQVVHPRRQAVAVRGDVGLVGEIPRAALDAFESDILAFPCLAQSGGCESSQRREQI